jgi:hypothetical protein
VNVYGYLQASLYNGIGRKSLPKLLPYPNLKYAQVCKQKEKGRVVEVLQRVVFGGAATIVAAATDNGRGIQKRLWNPTVLIPVARLTQHT